MLRFKKGDVVSYLFGEDPQYKIITTKEEPLARTNAPAINVSEGNDYIIIRTPLEGGGVVNGFLHVPDAHLDLISES